MEIRYSNEHKEMQRRYREMDKRHKKALRILLFSYCLISLSLILTVIKILWL